MPRRPGPSCRLVAPIVALCLATAGALVHAERADRFKPTNVEADRMQYDDLKQVTVFTGSVVLTKGTITIRGDRLVLEQDAEGYQHGTAIGKLASFRQKRDGGADEWVEGYGEEIYYDGRTERVRLVRRAKVKRLEGTRVVDEIDGAVIVYDGRTEQFDVEGAPGAGAAAGATPGGRVRVVIQPRLGDPAAPPPPAAGPRVEPRADTPR
ncbi:MAG TPA: lipopolysaccharide transport periplasmic protein LptA [Burkholderiaceae bacterium]|nr:lipopolysaccharide transport periplasmic protein LptA [Burkholderiaceae bacterium]